MKNVILMIGDGMGPHQVSLGRLMSRSSLYMDTLTLTGWQETSPFGGVVTDSAAAGTAIACGVKTRNKVIGKDSNGNDVKSIAVGFKEKGKRVGLVTTTRITHATPAAFFAHVHHRDQEQSILSQFPASGFDLLIGGGHRSSAASARTMMQNAGYEYFEYADIETFRSDPNSRTDRYVASLMEGRKHLSLEIDRHSNQQNAVLPTLDELTEIAIGDLQRASESDSKQGFFLMVEGGRIDHACHQQDAAAIGCETMAFDQAVRVACRFAEKNGETLVVVIADHSCGGVAISEKIDIEGLLSHTGSYEHILKTMSPTSAPVLQKFVQERNALDMDTESAIKIMSVDSYYQRTLLGSWMSAQRGVYFFPPEVQQNDLTETFGHDGTNTAIYVFGTDVPPGLKGYIRNDQLRAAIEEVVNDGG